MLKTLLDALFPDEASIDITTPAKEEYPQRNLVEPSAPDHLDNSNLISSNSSDYNKVLPDCNDLEIMDALTKQELGNELELFICMDAPEIKPINVPVGARVKGGEEHVEVLKTNVPEVKDSTTRDEDFNHLTPTLESDYIYNPQEEEAFLLGLMNRGIVVDNKRIKRSIYDFDYESGSHLSQIVMDDISSLNDESLLSVDDSEFKPPAVYNEGGKRKVSLFEKILKLFRRKS